MSKNKLAILLIVTSVLFGTLMLTFLKLAQENVNVFVAGFLRFFFGLIIILPYIIKTNFLVFKTTHIRDISAPKRINTLIIIPNCKYDGIAT